MNTFFNAKGTKYSAKYVTTNSEETQLCKEDAKH